MAVRVETYRQAFEGILGMRFEGKVKALVARMEQEGHTEKSICFTIWKKQDKLTAFKHDSRFLSIFENEVNKWSWKRGDPRWEEYNKRKAEHTKIKRYIKELNELSEDSRDLNFLDKELKRPPKHPKGYIYFIQGEYGGAIKIGYSTDPGKRLKELQTGHPDTLIVLLMIPGSEATERALHRRFNISRLKGKWFRPDDHVIEAIKELGCKFRGNSNQRRQP